MCPIIADSLESFEDTTTAARAGAETASASTMAAQSVFRKGPTSVRTAWYTLSVVAKRVKLTPGAATIRCLAVFFNAAVEPRDISTNCTGEQPR
jgi:hypothetical protein